MNEALDRPRRTDACRPDGLLDASTTIGQPVGEAELCGAFAQHRGPVLYFKRGHWSAYPLKGFSEGWAADADDDSIRPRRYCASDCIAIEL